eukprot:TRINITY_DN10903_c0_g1_i2.p1 TRINITY_DN10903_c0_g1~~TRINITY_DN10903_c0_g1_i2.p1  ORF type:complete len:121 (+),score=27.27 TRINITY_DN10903_c0_g1_i2:78-440(+)
MRQLKHHEKKLLKKVDFVQWKKEHNLREIQVMRRYHIQRREDYVHYTKLAGSIMKLSHRLQRLAPSDPFRIKLTDMILDRLFQMGVVNSKKSLQLCDKLTASAFCRYASASLLLFIQSLY